MAYERIFVPVDGSDASNAGLHEALRLAVNSGARLHIVHVVDALPILSVAESGADFTGAVESLRRSGRSLLERTRLEAVSQGIDPTTQLVENLDERVADVLTREADRCGADLIVMGTHGRRGLTRLIMGSDAELVLRNSTVPVLLVRAPEKKPTRRRGRGEPVGTAPA